MPFGGTLKRVACESYGLVNPNCRGSSRTYLTSSARFIASSMFFLTNAGHCICLMASSANACTGLFITRIFGSFYTPSMKFRFRKALMWLLLLALPLQGFAAATMINCGPNHHRMFSAAVTDRIESHHHAAVEPHQHSMGMADDHREMVGEAGTTDLPSVHHLDKLSKFKCSACAACCIGAALPTAALAIASVPPAMMTASFVPTLHADFLADGLDPPPRLLLA